MRFWSRMVLALEVIVTVVVTESMHPAESFTNNLIATLPVYLIINVHDAVPVIVSEKRALSAFHQNLEPETKVPVEVLEALMKVGKPQLCVVV